jgi:hypothetical protein
MVVTSLRKTVEHYRQLVSSITDVDAQQLEPLRGLPFYSDWHNTTVNDSSLASESRSESELSKSFNHAIGLPQKDGQPMPLFDYEQLLYNALQSNKHIWIKKATGLGVTEFMLRYMAWLCFNGGSVGNQLISGSQMCIVTGPRIELAITLIDRMKQLFLASDFLKLGQTKNKAASSFTTSSRAPGSSTPISFDTQETVIELNGVHIEAYPSHHLDSMRGLKDVSFIYLDEADFFPPGQQQDARDVSERYIAKSNPWIVMVSTPNAPEQLFDRIEHETESTCLYKRLFLDYTYGLGKIYTEAEIAAAKQSPSFEREYNLKYLGLVGNVFHTKDIEAAMERGRHFPDVGNSYTSKSVGLDPGFGSSAFGVCITELVDGMVNVLHAEEYPRPDFNEMIETTIQLLLKYKTTFEGRSRIFVDGANPSFIRALKTRVSEDDDYENMIDHLKHSYGSNFNLQSLIFNMFVVPIAFNKEHRNMLVYAKKLMEYGNGVVAINPKHTKLITALRTAVEKGEGTLDKEATSHDDVFDAFRMSLQYWVSN